MGKIEIKNTDLYYGDFYALKNINLDIPANQITAFIGPSGCGKSTLLKSLNRMNDLVEGCRITGELLLDGEERDKIWILRKFISTMSATEVVELLVDKMKLTKNNKAFFKAMNS